MLVYYLSIILIALVIAGVVLAKLHISKIVGENKGLIIFVYAIFIFGIIDMFWGLTYYDCVGMGVIGLKVSSSLFFATSSMLSYGWFLYAASLINDKKMSKKTYALWFVPALFVNIMVVMNIWTNQLFHVNSVTESYGRGPWYVAYRIVIDGYYLVIIFNAFYNYKKVI